MAIIEHSSMPFRPYARLMNVIGDQLITDKKVAVIEIIKNSYDADASVVKVRFCNMSNVGYNSLPKEEQAYIEIEDNGCGMSLDVIKNVWLRPATPNKFDKKKRHNLTTEKGRIVQGEKGIGRFAIHKLGEKIELYTKAKGENEVKLEMNFVDFNPDDANLFNQPADYKLLDEVANNWYVQDPSERVTRESGTIIRIYNIRELWSINDYKELYQNIQRMMPPVDENARLLGVNFVQDFTIEMYRDEKLYVDEDVRTFADVIERAQFSMIGTVDENGDVHFQYKSLSPRRFFADTLNLLDDSALSIRNYSLYGTKWFKDNDRSPQCGPFSFTFYAFDLKNKDLTILDKDLERFIKENFVFVMRDGIRVYPYGEKGIDWLDLDKLRSTYRAGQFISYNDLTGFVYISQEQNPLLKDATNRQGLVNDRGCYNDFKSLTTAVTEIFNYEIKIDKNKKAIQKRVPINKSNEALQSSLLRLQKSLEKSKDLETLELSNKFFDAYKKHIGVITDRMETVEDLAGLGMAVEKSSHDSIRILSLMAQNVKSFKKKLITHKYQEQDLIELFEELEENLNIVHEDMQMIQPLFKIQRQSIKNVSIKECISKVIRYFRNDIDGKIATNLDKIEDDLVIRTNAGLILQILINLIDNAIYWLGKSGNPEKKIHFAISLSNRTLIVGDNGNGIREDVVPLVFNEFFSMKSNGRGLGLYIVRELLSRINAQIAVIENPTEKLLSGANFIIKFDVEE
ncbi:MAG: ATP-binding protein [Muribaculaceae bacterium]|nr:ATP-binding protein [Muribaculaceae bacterium]